MRRRISLKKIWKKIIGFLKVIFENEKPAEAREPKAPASDEVKGEAPERSVPDDKPKAPAELGKRLLSTLRQKTVAGLLVGLILVLVLLVKFDFEVTKLKFNFGAFQGELEPGDKPTDIPALPTPTNTPVPTDTPIPPSPTASPTPSPTPPPQAQIGIARLGDTCEKSAEDLRVAIALQNQDIEIRIIESIVEESEDARQLAQNQDFILMIWGTCTAPSQLDLHFEIMTHNTPPLVFDLPSLSVDTSARDMSEAGDISEALIYYSLGGADNYAKAADLLDILTLKSEQLVFIKGNARLFQGFDHYYEALTAFEEIEDDTDLHPQALNNLGVTYFNLAVGYDLRGDNGDLDTSLEEAHKYFQQAMGATQDADLLSIIRVNQARLFYTYAGDDEEGDFQRALDICQDEESAPAYICRVAAAYQRQDLDPAERCTSDTRLQLWLDDLQQAENLDPNEAEPNYWRFIVNGFRLSCTESQAIQDALRNEANNYLEEFRNQTNARNALLEIDKYYLRAAPIPTIPSD